MRAENNLPAYVACAGIRRCGVTFSTRFTCKKKSANATHQVAFLLPQHLAFRSLTTASLFAPNTTMACHFLALPAELRQRIYTFIFQGPVVTRTYTIEQRRRYSSRSRPGDEQPQGYREKYAILLTNRTTFDEALVLYYNLTKFRLSFCELVHVPMTFQQLSHVRRIELDECCWGHYKWTANDGAGLEDILPRLQQFSRLETITLPGLMDIDEVDHADCFEQQATEGDLKDGFTSDEVYGGLVEAMTVGLLQTKVYVNAIGVIGKDDGRGGYEKTMIVSANDY